MPVDSHVQMPSSIMRGFSIKGRVRETYVFEPNARNLNSETIKKYGNIYAYYEDDAENCLGSVEAEFGLTKSQIINSFKKNEDYIFSDKDLERIKKFFMMAIGRNRNMASDIKYKSFFCSLFNLDVSNSEPIYLLDENYPKGEIFDGYNFSILWNKSETNFVCPENCLYSPLKSVKHLQNIPCVLFPITPQIALVMSKESVANVTIELDEAIEAFNEDALFSVLETDSTFIVSSTKEELEKLREVMSSEPFQKQVFILRLYNKARLLRIEDWHKLSQYEMDVLMIAYKNDVLPLDIKRKLIDLLESNGKY